MAVPMSALIVSPSIDRSRSVSGGRNGDTLRQPSLGQRYRVRLLLWSLRQLFRVEYDDLMTGVTRTPTFLVLYPNGQIPTLVDGGFVLQEPNAILCYRAEGTPYLPQEPQTKE